MLTCKGDNEKVMHQKKSLRTFQDLSDNQLPHLSNKQRAQQANTMNVKRRISIVKNPQKSNCEPKPPSTTNPIAEC